MKLQYISNDPSAKHSKHTIWTGSKNAMPVKYCLRSAYGNAVARTSGIIARPTVAVHVGNIILILDANPMGKPLKQPANKKMPNEQGQLAQPHLRTCWRKTYEERNGNVMKTMSGSMKQSSFLANPISDPSKFPR